MAMPNGLLHGPQVSKADSGVARRCPSFTSGGPGTAVGIISGDDKLGGLWIPGEVGNKLEQLRYGPY